MNIDGCHIPRNATLQPLGADLWRRSRPEISSRVHNQWKKDAQELARNLEAHLICRNREATKFNAQNGCPIIREDCVLLTAQVKGVCLNVKPPYQSFPDPMPHSEWGDLKEVRKALLSQKLNISLVGPRSEYKPYKNGPSTPTSDLVRPLHSKSEAIY